jgi:hypothetical protein
MVYNSVDTALAAAKLALKIGGGAPRELNLAVEAYAAELKRKTSSMLQVWSTRVSSCQIISCAMKYCSVSPQLQECFLQMYPAQHTW